MNNHNAAVRHVAGFGLIELMIAMVLANVFFRYVLHKPLVWGDEVASLSFIWMAMLGVFCTGVAHSIFVASLSVLKARTASMFFALEPVYGIAIAWVLFHERPTPLMLVGGLLIIAAIALTSLRKAPEPAAAV